MMAQAANLVLAWTIPIRVVYDGLLLVWHAVSENVNLEPWAFGTNLTQQVMNYTFT